MRFRQLNIESWEPAIRFWRVRNARERVRQIGALAWYGLLVASVLSARSALAQGRAVAEVSVQPSEATLHAAAPEAGTPEAATLDAATPIAVTPAAATPGPPPAGPADGAPEAGNATPAGDGSEVTPVATQTKAAARKAERAYRTQFERARKALIDNRDQEALEAFEVLARDAPSAEDRRIAEEFANLARERVAANKGKLPPPHIRTTDELSVLYTTAFTYGFGTSAWLALQLKPSNFAAAVLPFVAITGAAVGGVALVDSYSPFRLGVPQSISAGTILGTLEGMWLVGYQHAVATRRDEQQWRSPTVATVLWAGATVGGVAGGLLGAAREPTPGQVSYTTSGGLWGGIAGALIAGAAESQKTYRAERAYAVGALGYNLALIAALATSPQLEPSVARVRLIDLGGLAGGLLGAGGYLLVADESANSRAAMGTAAGGALVGLGLSWWATSGMPAEPHPPPEQPLLSRLRPTVIPVRQGAVGVLELTL